MKVILLLAVKMLAGGEAESRKTDKMEAVIAQTLFRGVERHKWKMTILSRAYKMNLNPDTWYQHALSLPHLCPLLFYTPHPHPRPHRMMKAYPQPGLHLSLTFPATPCSWQCIE